MPLQSGKKSIAYTIFTSNGMLIIFSLFNVEVSQLQRYSTLMNGRLLKSLNVFVNVADSGTMSAAAKMLDMTVSAISQHLSKLEQDIGLSLFNRNSRQLSLTEAGRIYYRTSLTLLDTAEQAQHQLEQLQGTPSGDLRLKVQVALGAATLSTPIKQLIQDYPQLNVSLQFCCDSEKHGNFDADILLSDTASTVSNQSTTQIGNVRQSLVVARHHPLAQFDSVTSQDLDQHLHIALAGQHHAVFKMGQRKAQTLAASRLTVNNLSSMLQMVRHGLGYAVVPQSDVQSELDAGTLVSLATPGILPTYKLFAITPSGATVTPKSHIAIDYLQRHLSAI